MSFVLVATEALETAAADAAQIGSALTNGHLAAAIPTTQLAAAGADEVSTAIAAFFGAHGQEYQAVAARAASYYERFVRTLSSAAASYSGAEAAIATSLQGPLGAASTDPVGALEQAWVTSPLGRFVDPIINAPTEALFGRDLIGDGGAPTGAGKPIVIEFVRHGQSLGNAANLIDTAVPGPPLTALGQQQAQAVANVLKLQGPYAGIFSSQLIRAEDTAAPLATALGLANVPALIGLNEVNAGIFDGATQVSPQGLLYLMGPMAWTLGLPMVPMLAPGSTNFNGIVFDQGFTQALNTMYGTAMANPVVAASGKITEVAYASEFSIEVGTLMHVNNPDPLLMLTHPLPNTGTVVVQGDPHGGWTLVSWDGVPVPPANLPTKLFVDVRDLITAPQFAVWNGVESLFTGDPGTIANAAVDGADQVAVATVKFPFAVARDLIDAVENTSLSGLETELAGLIP